MLYIGKDPTRHLKARLLALRHAPPTTQEEFAVICLSFEVAANSRAPTLCTHAVRAAQLKNRLPKTNAIGLASLRGPFRVVAC